MATKHHPADLNVFRDRLKGALKERGLSAASLERTLGVSGGTFTRIYAGRKPLDAELITQVGKALELDPRELVADTSLADLLGPAPAPAPESEPVPAGPADPQPSPSPSPSSSWQEPEPSPATWSEPDPPRRKSRRSKVFKAVRSVVEGVAELLGLR